MAQASETERFFTHKDASSKEIFFTHRCPNRMSLKLISVETCDKRRGKTRKSHNGGNYSAFPECVGCEGPVALDTPEPVVSQDVVQLKPHLCKECGETDSSQFYATQKSICMRCYNLRAAAKHNEIKSMNKAKVASRIVPPADSGPEYLYDCPTHGPHNGGIIAGKTPTKNCPVCTEEKRRASFSKSRPPQGQSLSVVVHFPEVSLHKWIKDTALDQERTLEQQIRFMLRKFIDQQRAE